MSTESHTPLAFAYRAQTRDGQTISGTIDAISLAEATKRLESLPLSGLKIEPAAHIPRPGALRGDDFAAFNQQLAQLTAAGLPVEQGLRLIAAEMGRGSLRRTLDLVAGDLEKGMTLPQAIEKHRGQFPSLYAHLVDAGIRTGNLPRILLNLGRHLTLVRRLQAMLWRTFPYPILLCFGFIAMVWLFLARVVPQFQGIFKDFHTELPMLTQIVMSISQGASGTMGQVLLTLMGLTVAAFILVWMTGRERVVGERVLLWIPLIGPVLRRNLISRWCDAVGIGVDAGMDLPAAIGMADDAIGSAALRSDGQAIISAISSGRPIADVRRGRVLPPMVISAIDLSAQKNDLPQGLLSLSQLYQQQAELRLGAAEVILMPMLIIFLGIIIGLVVMAMFAPMISLIDAVSSPWPHHN